MLTPSISDVPIERLNEQNRGVAVFSERNVKDSAWEASPVIDDATLVAVWLDAVLLYLDVVVKASVC